jgi:hypothetical protein
MSHEARSVPLKRATLASNPGQTAVRLGRVVRCCPLGPSISAAAFLLFAALVFNGYDLLVSTGRIVLNGDGAAEETTPR